MAIRHPEGEVSFEAPGAVVRLDRTGTIAAIDVKADIPDALLEAYVSGNPDKISNAIKGRLQAPSEVKTPPSLGQRLRALLFP